MEEADCSGTSKILSDYTVYARVNFVYVIFYVHCVRLHHSLYVLRPVRRKCKISATAACCSVQPRHHVI
jgi:hypothetical protein